MKDTSRRFALAFLVLLSSFVLTEKAFALSPDTPWEQIETDHFYIVYDSRHKELGALYARAAEQSWAAASPVFGLWPRKTTILVDDSTDVANGSATGVPYPLIIAYPVLPSSLDGVADYGNWGVELLTHEYVHILNFEPATGVMRPLRWIFGTVVRPNMLLPRWYSEGLAVELETRLSTYGRLRSANYLSIIRAMVEERTLTRENIARVNEVSIPEWPGGVRPYLMGALIWDQLVHEKGDGIIGDLNLAHSRRIPFFINGPVEDRLGVGYENILYRAYARATGMVEKQIELIRAAKQPDETFRNDDGYFNHSFVFSPDGTRTAWVQKTHNLELVKTADREGLTSTEAESKRDLTPPTENEGGLITRVSWFPDSKRLVHDSVDLYSRFFERSDLYILDIATNKGKQITRGLRAREPVVSPDGKHIVFTQVTPASTRLASVNENGEDATVLYTPPIQTRISRAEFIAPGQVLFSEKRDDGAEVFKVLNVRAEGGKLIASAEAPRVVLADFKPVHYPRMTKTGLLFVSDRSGVANLYLANRDLTSARPVTNSTTRILTGDIDPQSGDLWYSRLESAGAHLFSSPRDSWTVWSKEHAQVPQVGSVLETKWPDFRAPQVDVKIEPTSYSPWRYMLPRYWIPYVSIGSDASYYSAQTSANDPTGRHAYSLSLNYSTLTNSSSQFFVYTNSTTPVALRLSGVNSSEFIFNGGPARRSTNASLDGSFFLPKLSNRWRGSLGWDYSTTVIDTLSLKRNGVSTEIGYRNAPQRGYEISPEHGGAFNLGYTRYLPQISDSEYEVVSLNASKFLSGWLLPERHVFALFLNSSIAPRLSSSYFGVVTNGGNYQTLPGLRGFTMRGYSSGTFLGRNVIQGTAEYRFPFYYAYRGSGTLPFFVQRFHGAVFADAITLDGGVYDTVDKKYSGEKLGRPFYGTGAEIKLDATIAYHLPMQIIFGLYYGTDSRANPFGLFPSISLGL